MFVTAHLGLCSGLTLRDSHHSLTFGSWGVAVAPFTSGIFILFFFFLTKDMERQKRKQRSGACAAMPMFASSVVWQIKLSSWQKGCSSVDKAGGKHFFTVQSAILPCSAINAGWMLFLHIFHYLFLFFSLSQKKKSWIQSNKMYPRSVQYTQGFFVCLFRPCVSGMNRSDAEFLFFCFFVQTFWGTREQQEQEESLFISHIIQCTTWWEWYSVFSPSWGRSRQRTAAVEQLQISAWRIHLRSMIWWRRKPELPEGTNASTEITCRKATQEGPARTRTWAQHGVIHVCPRVSQILSLWRNTACSYWTYHTVHWALNKTLGHSSRPLSHLCLYKSWSRNVTFNQPKSRFSAHSFASWAEF